jgi:transposase InsO family protein
LTVHSDNGPQMRSDAMNEFYAIAGISQSRSRPRVCLFTGYSDGAKTENSLEKTPQLAA